MLLPSSPDELNDLLLTMAAAGDAAAIRSLLEAGADPAYVDETADNPRTAFLEAANLSVDLPECLEALLPVSDPEARDKNGNTALMLAAARGNLESMALLMPHGDLEAVNHQGTTALHCAVIAGSANRIAAARMLADAMATLDQPQENGRTALHSAVFFGADDLVEILLPRSDPLAQDGAGSTPYMIAILCDDADQNWIRALEPLSDQAVVNNNGDCALDIAVSVEQWATADRLAPKSPRDRAQAAFLVAGAENMPGWAAVVESEVLGAEVAAVSNATRSLASNGGALSRSAPNRKPRAL